MKKILNLGCGAKTSNEPEVINIDWSIHLRVKKNKILAPLVPIFFNGERLERFRQLPDNIMVHNLAKGIPFASESVDVVYHSHMLEHLDRDVARDFLLEVKRVLKPGGIQRIVVPDMEWACRRYIEHFSACEGSIQEAKLHEDYMAKFLDQCVRREAFGTSQQGPVRRFIENIVLGDARKRGETHQWMYDRVSLSTKLIELGYTATHIHDMHTSHIPDWSKYGLDVDAEGNPRNGWSLYVEAVK